MTQMALPLGGNRGLAKAGVPADPPDDAPAGEYALSLQRITNLVSTPQLFFELNPTFASLRESVDRALQVLMQAGIINYAGQPVRRTGCGGCSRRRLLAFAIQFASRFQTVILQAQDNPEQKAVVERNLRAYIQRKTPSDLENNMPIVLYARLKNNKVRKVVL